MPLPSPASWCSSPLCFCGLRAAWRWGSVRGAALVSSPAAGATLGVLLPPSTVLASSGIIPEQEIGKLFIAGILPGILAVSMYIAAISIIGWLRPQFLPAGEPAGMAERLAAVRDIWAPLALFAFVIGGPLRRGFPPPPRGGRGARGGRPDAGGGGVAAPPRHRP